MPPREYLRHRDEGVLVEAGVNNTGEPGSGVAYSRAPLPIPHRQNRPWISLRSMPGYPVLGVRAGYAEWVPTYEATVHDEMDLGLLRRVRAVDSGWPTRACAASTVST